MAGEERVTKLKIDNVKKIYQTRKGEMTALNGVNLDIKENEFICVVGPSGCGKSTLLNIIAGLDTPTSGAVYIDGKKIEGTGTERGVVFQQYALFPWLTVLKNVMFGLKLQGKSDAEAKEIAMKYIKMVQLEDFVNHYPKELSGGMKQRVAPRQSRCRHFPIQRPKHRLNMLMMNAFCSSNPHSELWMPRQEPSCRQNF